MSKLNILVAIANYGEKNRQYLERLLDTYRAMPAKIKIVVLSNISKDLDEDIEVRVGLPSDNPWSLPFAHRQLFRENLDHYEFFVYSEDDTLMTWEAIQAFVEAEKSLAENEIAGFLRFERNANGERYYSTCHSFFRWIPSTVREIGGHLWACYSNEHSACYIISQAKLRVAIASGGFLTDPHEGRYDMLCAAATDVYTQCGFEKLVCLDNLKNYTLPHLPNKYIGKMGLPEVEMEWHAEALRKIFKRELSDYELLNTETKLPMGIGSKWYREPPDSKIGQLIEGNAKKILVWGAGDGVFEAGLMELGNEVYVVPLDSVVGECCRKRGLKVLKYNSWDVPVLDDSFDLVILRDILHLLDKPKDLLEKICQFLGGSGELVARIPNFYDVKLCRRRLTDPRFRMPWSKEGLGAIPFTQRGLRKIACAAGFKKINIDLDVPVGRARMNIISLGVFSNFFSPYLYLICR